MSPGTVNTHLRLAREAGLTWLVPAGMEVAALEALLFPLTAPSCFRRPEPDWGYIHKELKRRGVTVSLLWQEHRQTNPWAPAIAASASCIGLLQGSSTSFCARSTAPERRPSSTGPVRPSP